MQGLCNVPLTEGWVIAILCVLGLLLVLTLVAIPPYVQSGLNKVWNLYPPAEDGQMVLSPPRPSRSQP
jgi:hypothetical protein